MKVVHALLYILPSALCFSVLPTSSSVTFQRNIDGTHLQMVDQNVIEGIGVGVFGLAFGIGMVAFTEGQGERAKERGGGISENMATKIAGQLLEDVEVSSVSDLGSLTSQLEKALMETGAAAEEELKMSEEDKERIAKEADDGW